MDGALTTRTTLEKVALFERDFTGLTDAHGTYDPNDPSKPAPDQWGLLEQEYRSTRADG